MGRRRLFGLPRPIVIHVFQGYMELFDWHSSDDLAVVFDNETGVLCLWRGE